ncbi:hypothetical protein SAMD00019534_042280 [Acytostelium subglobosum LB1]|uniref:hypothetical protein n=1 Tax=Acytostelium subglobosum LB1 TaxID=1410327 RepID=UPI00064487DE|nr:hypothetical protein SAMD00019534_042280 [Acytostelium subglobosum LB1]GAM21053.1 hypothetical protein SAMD00019534_042280 [Acytostelium subglobosum LB1]|eukprot:XP_012756187.1 hypothetical protein SAMD00019534_042280 [Acytostelium subglobosum LB1]
MTSPADLPWLPRWKRPLTSNLDIITLTEQEKKEIAPLEGQMAKYMIWRKWMLYYSMIPALAVIILQAVVSFQTGKWTRPPGAALKNGLNKLTTTGAASIVELDTDYIGGNGAARVTLDYQVDTMSSWEKLEGNYYGMSLANTTNNTNTNTSDSFCDHCDDCNNCPDCDWCNCDACGDCYDCPDCEGCEEICDECTDCYDCPNCDKCLICQDCVDADENNSTTSLNGTVCPEQCTQETYTNDEIFSQNFAVNQIAKFDKKQLTKKFLLATNITYICILGLSFIFYVLALIYWKSFGKSSQMLLIAWGVAFLVPFVIHLLPISSIIFRDMPVLKDGPNKADFKYIGGVMSARVMFAIESHMKLTPASLAIIPALIKSTACMKMLLPQSPILGFLIKGMRIMRIPIFLAGAIFVYQLACDYFFCACVICLALSQLIYVLPIPGRGITKPFASGNEIAIRMRLVTRIALLFTLLALVFLILFFLNLAKPLVGFGRLDRIKWDNVANFIPIPNPVSIALIFSNFFLKYFIATLTFCDLMMWIVRKIYVYTRDYPELIASYNQEMEKTLWKVLTKKEKRNQQHEIELNAR